LEFDNGIIPEGSVLFTVIVTGTDKEVTMRRTYLFVPFEVRICRRFFCLLKRLEAVVAKRKQI
jgi:hypothetical protein